MCEASLRESFLKSALKSRKTWPSIKAVANQRRTDAMWFLFLSSPSSLLLSGRQNFPSVSQGTGHAPSRQYYACQSSEI